MARLVRCPKCSKLLVEDPKVPVYKCGGCNTFLRAKNHKAPSENVVPGSMQTNSVDTSPEQALSDVSTSSTNEMLSSSLPAPSTQENSTGGSPQLKQPDVISENGFSDKEMPPPCSSTPSVEEEHEDEEKRPNLSSPDSAENCKHHEIEEQLESETKVTEIKTQQDEVIQSENDDSSSEQAENPLETSNKVEQSSQPMAEGTALMEGVVDTEQHYGHDTGLKSLANLSPQAYDGSISSSDDGHRSNRHPLPRRITSCAKDKEEIDSMASNLDKEDQARALLSKSGKESYYFDVFKSFDAIKQEISFDYPSGELAQRRSFDSAEFVSVDSLMNSEKIGPYESPLRDSRGDFSNHIELLRKVDELKAQIMDLCAQKDRSIPSYTIGYRRNRLHEYPQLPFSGHTHCSCLHCSENQYTHFPAHELHSNSSNSGSLGKHNHKLEKSHSKEKPKRHCRPVSGAAPFVICYHCMKLLQLPTDFIISRRKLHKLQCGACDEILMLSFPGNARLQPENQSEMEGKNGKVGFSSHPVNYPRDAKDNAPPWLHRLMGYDSASELLYTRSEFDEGYESMFSPARYPCRPSAQIHDSIGTIARGRGSPGNEQIRYAGSPSSMNHSEYDSPRRLSAIRAAVLRSGSTKQSPSSM